MIVWRRYSLTGRVRFHFGEAQGFMSERLPRLTSNQLFRMVHEPAKYILLCGMCGKPIGNKARSGYEYTEPGWTHKKHGEVHERCYVALLPPTKRAKLRQSIRRSRNTEYVV